MAQCEIDNCKICNIKNSININKTLLFKIFPIYFSSNLYDGLELPELRNIVIDYVFEVNKVNFNRLDFIDYYVGWTSYKTLDLLEFNRDKIIIINDPHSLIKCKNDVFGIEAINAIKNFIVQNNDVVIIFK